MRAADRNWDIIAAEYRAALSDYLRGRSESALRRAYETGRRGLASGMGVLEMAAAHREAVDAMLGETAEPERASVILDASIPRFSTRSSSRSAAGPIRG